MSFNERRLAIIYLIKGENGNLVYHGAKYERGYEHSHEHEHVRVHEEKRIRRWY